MDAGMNVTSVVLQYSRNQEKKIFSKSCCLPFCYLTPIIYYILFLPLGMKHNSICRKYSPWLRATNCLDAVAWVHNISSCSLTFQSNIFLRGIWYKREEKGKEEAVTVFKLAQINQFLTLLYYAEHQRMKAQPEYYGGKGGEVRKNIWVEKY